MSHLTQKDAESLFMKALENCGMEKMFSMKQFTAWTTNEKKYGETFPVKALFYLCPEDVSEHHFSKVLDAAVILSNAIPRKMLGGKSPQEASFPGKKQYSTSRFDRDAIFKKLIIAGTAMREGKYEDGYHMFENVIQGLLDERIPLFSACRIFINASICQRYLQEFGMCKALIDASLRLNPHYDFGWKIAQNYESEIRNVSDIPKKDQKVFKKSLELDELRAQHHYKKTVFKKYEKFLEDYGISLAFATKTTPTTYINGRQQ